MFEPFTLPAGSELADRVWSLTVKIVDVYWATRVVNLRAKIGRCSLTSVRVHNLGAALIFFFF